MATSEWLRELCPEIAEWQAELIAQKIDILREANEAFGKRQEWWGKRMFELEHELLAEREACAKAAEKQFEPEVWQRLEKAWLIGYDAGREAEREVFHALLLEIKRKCEDAERMWQIGDFIND